MKKENIKFIINLNTPIHYFIDQRLASMQEFMNLEYGAFLNARMKQHRLFKLYDSDSFIFNPSFGSTIVGMN